MLFVVFCRERSDQVGKLPVQRLSACPVIPGVRLRRSAATRARDRASCPARPSSVATCPSWSPPRTLVENEIRYRALPLDNCIFHDTGNRLLQFLVDTFHSEPDVVPLSLVILAMFPRHAYNTLAQLCYRRLFASTPQLPVEPLPRQPHACLLFCFSSGLRLFANHLAPLFSDSLGLLRFSDSPGLFFFSESSSLSSAKRSTSSATIVLPPLRQGARPPLRRSI